MKRSLLLLLLILSLLAAPCHAGAEAYSLMQCLTLAKPLAEEIKLAEEALVLARQDRIRARSALTPNIELSASVEGSYRDMDGASGPPIRMREETLSGFAGLGFRYSFYLNGRELIAYRAAGELIAKSRSDLEVARRDYTLQVAAGFYATIRSTRGVRIAEANLKRLKAHREAVNSRIDAGLLTRTEALRAEAQVAEGKAALTEAKNRLAISRSQLRKLVPFEEGFRLSEPDFTIPPIPAPTLASAIEMAQLQRPELTSTKLAAHVAGRQVDVTRSLFWPKVTLEGSAGLQNDDISGRYDSADNDFTRDTTAYSAKLSVSMPLIDGGLRSADVAKTESDERSARHRVRLTVKEVKRQVEEAWYTRITQKERLSALEENQLYSRQFLESVTQQFREGLAQSLDLMDANTRLVEAENNLEDARFALMLAAIQLRHAAGVEPLE